jgi:hypothetical protein
VAFIYVHIYIYTSGFIINNIIEGNSMANTGMESGNGSSGVCIPQEAKVVMYSTSAAAGTSGLSSLSL